MKNLLMKSKLFALGLMLLSGLAHADPVSDEWLQNMVLTSYFSNPVGDNAIRMRSFLLDASLTSEFKMKAYPVWENIVKLRVLEDKADNDSPSKRSREITSQVKEVRKSIATFLSKIDTSSSSEALVRFSQVLMDPIPELNRDAIVKEVFEAVNAKHQRGFGSHLAEFLNRHPITTFVQLAFGVIAFATGTGGNDLGSVLAVDAMFSVGFLVVFESRLGPEVDKQVNEIENVRDGTSLVLQKANARSFEFRPEAALAAAATFSEAFELFHRSVVDDVDLVYRKAVAALVQEVLKISSKLSLNDRADLAHLEAREAKAKKLLEDLQKLNAEFRARMDRKMDIENVYSSGRYVEFFKLLNKIRSEKSAAESIYPGIVQALSNGSVDFVEAEFLRNALAETAVEGSVDELRQLAEKSQPERLRFLQQVSAQAIATETKVYDVVKTAVTDGERLMLETQARVASISENLKESSRLALVRKEKEVAAEKQREEVRKEQERVRAIQAAEAAEKIKVSSWISEGKLSPHSIGSDLTKVTESIRHKVTQVLNGIYERRGRTGSFESNFRISPGGFETELMTPMKAYKQELLDLKSRMIMGLKKDPTTAPNYIAVIERYNKLLEMQLGFWDGGGFFQRQHYETARVFGKCPEISSEKVSGAVLGAIAIGIVAKHAGLPSESGLHPSLECSSLFAM